MIKFESVSYSIKSKTLVEQISLTIPRGNVTVLLGPNGAGKSTCLKLACGEYRPTTGSIQLGNKFLQHLTPQEKATSHAVVSQSSSLGFPFPSFEVVLMGRMPHNKYTTPADTKIAWAAMERVGVTHLAAQAYTTLSGGEQQRVHLARALAQIWDESKNNTPRYLFLDEPTASLDLQYQHSILQLAKSMAADGVGVLIVLHDLNLAAQYADRVGLMANGRLQVLGQPDEVLTAENIREVFSVHTCISRHPQHPCPLIVPLHPVVHPPLNDHSSHTNTLTVPSS
ncbi:MAG: heme ABC transporter ATP-binding protein [Bacteroidota bacterium]